MSKLRHALTIGLLAAALGLAAGGTALARIEPVCENPGGQEPQGQCQGNALVEENRNPAGHAPAGQNK